MHKTQRQTSEITDQKTVFETNAMSKAISEGRKTRVRYLVLPTAPSPTTTSFTRVAPASYQNVKIQCSDDILTPTIFRLLSSQSIEYRSVPPHQRPHRHRHRRHVQPLLSFSLLVLFKRVPGRNFCCHGLQSNSITKRRIAAATI
jgi:hypothetical protein